MKKNQFSFLILFFCLWTINKQGFCQLQEHIEKEIEREEVNRKKGEFQIAPYTNYSSTLGFGFGLIPMYTFNTGVKDSISPKSLLGIGAYRTTEKSGAAGAFGALFLDEDKWRIQYGGGVANYNFQTYFEPFFIDSGQGIFLDYGTNAYFGTLNVRRSIGKGYYAGLGYLYQHLETKFDIPFTPEIETELSMLQFDMMRDTRDQINYPKSGAKALARLQYMPTWAGNDVNSEVVLVNYNRYFGVNNNRDVIAARFHTKAGLKNVRFQQQVVLGGVDLRGYSSGKYRGDGIMDVQGEYRWNFPNKLDLSAVGFAGVGTLYGSSTPSFDWKLYPSIGGGIRYTAVKSAHINVGLDAGVGKDDWGVYFRFSEAF